MAAKGQNGQYTSPCKFAYLSYRKQNFESYLLDFMICPKVIKGLEGFWMQKFLNFGFRKRRRTSRAIKAKQHKSMMRICNDRHSTSYFRFLSRSIWKHKRCKNGAE